MRQTLYIHLRGQADTDTLPYRVDGAATGATRHDTLPRIADAAPGARVVVIVPASQVRLLRVPLPVRSRNRAREAAPFACEDQLAEDIERLHFAHLGRDDNDEHAFAVVSHARMRGWLEQLSAAGLRPSVIVPENLCLPEPDAGAWTVCRDEGASMLLLRQSTYIGTAIHTDALATWIELSEDAAPERVQLLQRGDAPALALPESVEVHSRPLFGSLLDLFVSEIDRAEAFNLLQGDYAPENNLARHFRPWRAAAALAAAVVVLMFTLSILETRAIRKQAVAQEHANVERFQQVFPGYRNVTAAQLPSFVAAEIRRLEGGGDETQLLSLLDSYAQAASSTRGLSLQGVQWRDRGLLLNIRGETLEDLEALRQWYDRFDPVHMEVENANASADGVQIRVRLRAA